MKQLFFNIILLIALSIPALFCLHSAAAIGALSKFCNSSHTASTTSVCVSDANQNGQGTNPVIRIIKAAIEVISYIAGAAAIIGILVSAIRFITAGGDSNAVASARTSLSYSLVGIAVMALAQALVAFILNKL